MKHKRLILCFFVIVFINYAAVSQSFLKGKVVDHMYDRVVIGATVRNLSMANELSQSDMGGNYKIKAVADDRIVFSSTGYISDTITVTQDMLNGLYDVSLAHNVIELEEVSVGELNAYQVDSISRLEEFGDALGKSKSKLVGGRGNTPTDGVGVTFSPISHFSKKEKEQRRFKRMFHKQEEEYYIDYKFPYQYISQITGLKGDSLRTFMFAYRPSYEFCRANDKSAMLVYINDKYRAFMNKPNLPQSDSKHVKGKKN